MKAWILDWADRRRPQLAGFALGALIAAIASAVSIWTTTRGCQ
jgi:hypothetical protein